MVLYGIIHRVGDKITTDDIIAPEWRDAGDPAILAAHCLEKIEPMLAEQVREGDLLLAGDSFGGGPDAEQAVLALQALGFAAVVCCSAEVSFSEIAQIYGLPLVHCPAAVAVLQPGAVARLDLTTGRIVDRSSGAAFDAPPCPPEVVDAVRRAQLLSRMRRVVEDEEFDG